MNIPEITKQLTNHITAPDSIMCLAGLILLGGWLLKTSWGRNALADSAPRRNNMPAYLPFIPLLIWFGGISLALSIAGKALPDLPEWQNAFLDNFITCIGAIAAMVLIIFLAKSHFARQLKGFGLKVKTIPKDFLVAVVNLFSVWPIVVLMIILTIFLGQFIQGPDFKLPRHQELELITAHPQLSLRLLIIITAIGVVPVFEEMLFRGMFQTMIRSFVIKPWLSILVSSGLFAMAHPNPEHWPALFALSMSMGYAYEKSGSLFRPIFIHSLFNATSVIAALYQ
jgi:membrane protease YdiL (CAAX protease family)